MDGAISTLLCNATISTFSSVLCVQQQLGNLQPYAYVACLLLPHESDRSQKLLFKTEKIRQPNFKNWIVWFYRDRWQSGAPLGCDDELFVRPSDICTMEKLEPQQLKELWQRVVDLIKVKWEEKKTRATSVKNINSIDCVGVSLQSVVTYAYIGSKT
jgi:hypothetical protein